MTAERHSQHPSLGPHERSRASEEDYLACILGLLEQKGYARVVDVAYCLSITQASVSAMVKRLAARGYVQRERYRGFTLTERGRATAREVRRRRQVLTAFFKSLGLPPNVIDRDVHGLEHHLSEATLEALERFLRADRRPDGTSEEGKASR
jgi:Mn-dependent DtxR family transcriptional regulator